MTVIKRAQHLLETAWYGELNDIMQCRAKLMVEYTNAEQDYSVSFQRYELDRVNKYLEIKEKKHNGETKMSDWHIDRFAKHHALKDNDYITEKAYVKIVNKYLDELRAKTIYLMHQAKDTL